MGSSGGAFLVPANLPASVVQDTWLPINVLDPKYGAKGNGVTDDTAAVQAAINAVAASSAARGHVVLPSGYEFLLGGISIAPGVHLWAHGAKIIPNPANWANTRGLIVWTNNAGVLVDAGIHGGLWAGTGTETNHQFLFEVKSGAGVKDLVIDGTTVTNWAVGPFYIRNPLHARVLGNILETVDVGDAANFNAIDFAFDGSIATPLGCIVALGNIIDTVQSDAICVENPSGTFNGACRAVIADNITNGAGTSFADSGGISFELDVAGDTVSNVDIHDNDINASANNSAGGIGTYGILIGGAPSGGAPATKVLIHHNNIKATNAGTAGCNGIVLNSVGVDATVTDNRIDAPTPIFEFNGKFNLRSGNRFSTGPCSGRAVLVAGTVPVNTAEVQANDNISLTPVVSGGAPGAVRVSAIVPGVSFTITSTSGTDTSTVYWKIDH